MTCDFMFIAALRSWSRVVDKVTVFLFSMARMLMNLMSLDYKNMSRMNQLPFRSPRFDLAELFRFQFAVLWIHLGPREQVVERA